ncbi:hypothetical protein ABIF36_002081 [Bradyrhizobium japonicum]
MTTVKRGTRVPARWRLLVCALTLLAGCSKEPLTADPDVDMPAPKQSSFSQFRTTHAHDAKVPLRLEIEARVPAELSEVLAFYRRELGQRGWQEKPDDAVIAADRVQLAFVSPKGPAVLKLGRATGRDHGQPGAAESGGCSQGRCPADIRTSAADIRLSKAGCGFACDQRSNHQDRGRRKSSTNAGSAARHVFLRATRVGPSGAHRYRHPGLRRGLGPQRR